GIEPDPKRVKAILELRNPENVKELQSVIGTIMYYHDYIPNLADIMDPLYNLLKKDVKFDFDDKCQKSMQTIKECLSSKPILTHFDPQYDHEVRIDASNTGMGCVLIQNEPDGDKPVHFGSKTYKKHQRNWHSNKKEFYTAYWAVCKELSVYVQGIFFTLKCDNKAVVSMITNSKCSQAEFRWINNLQMYNFKIEHRKGSKNTDADMQSRLHPKSETKLNRCLVLKNFTKDNMFSLQKEDEYCSRILGDLNKENVPKNISDYFFTINSILYRTYSNDDENYTQLVIPKKLINELLLQFHDCPTSGHFSTQATFERIRQKYFFENMFKIVENYCKTCEKCQLKKSSHKLKPGIGEYFKVDYPFQRVQIDITGPFQETENGNKYIVAAVDHFSKYIELKAIPNQSSYEIAKFIHERILCTHGPPRQLMSDRGKVFISEIVQAIIAINPPTIQKFTSGYHPASNGNVERINGIVKNVLRCFTNENTDDWDLFVMTSQYAYNTKINATTGMSPFQIIYNRTPYNILDLQLNVDQNNEDTYDHNARKRWQKQIEIVNKRMKEKQLKNMKRFNENHRQNIFIIGDIVKLKRRQLNPDLKSKLQAPYEGKYLVIDKKSDTVYLIMKYADPTKQLTVNVENIELFYDRDESEQDANNENKMSDSERESIHEPEYSNDDNLSDTTEIYDYTNLPEARQLRNRAKIKAPKRLTY
ncbi:pol polyprotein-like protein, partial [Leptotrombidium deliense]